MRTFRIRRDGWWVLADILKANEPFRTAGSMRGELNVSPTKGQMPHEEYELMCFHAGRQIDGKLSYAVYSYETIIGYRVDGVWRVPDCKYSNTTTIQQNKLRVAIDA